MRSTVADTMPSKVRRSLQKFGADISIARKKRGLTMAMMVERIGVSKSTYLRVEKGDPTVSMGIYAMALFALGLGDALGDVADPGKDDQGLLLDAERLPQRVRPKKQAKPL